MRSPVKAALIESLVGVLEAERATVAAAQRLSQEGATHEDSRSEGDKDMRATEASYIARGQALRVEALDQDLVRVHAMTARDFAEGDPIALGAVVCVATGEGAESLLFVAPAGGGAKLTHGEARVTVVTPAAPLGRALVGARAGDTVEVHRGGRLEALDILRVS